MLLRKHLEDTIPNLNIERYCSDAEGSTGKLTPELSIVIPAYNMERWIERSVESVLKQKDIVKEIIIVNDGSKDGTAIICEAIAKKNTNVIVINQKNTGLYQARVTGMKVAKGEFITFVDADDYVLPDFYAGVLKVLKESSADIIEFGIKKVQGEKTIYTFSPKKEIYNATEAIRRQFENGCSSCSNCNKIYKRRLFDKVEFCEDLRCHEEDKLINIKVMCECERVVSIPDVGYIYDTRDNSITTKKISSEYLAILDVSRVIYEYVKDHKVSLSRVAGMEYCAHLAYCGIRLSDMGLALEKKQDLLRDIKLKFDGVYENENLRKYRTVNISVNRRIMVSLFHINSYIAEIVYKLFKR